MYKDDKMNECRHILTILKNKIFYHIMEIINDKIFIKRSEGWGYVQNMCDYNTEAFELVYEQCAPSPNEGGNCLVTYEFKIKQNNVANSYIIFIEDYGYKKYTTTYIYQNNKLELKK